MHKVVVVSLLVLIKAYCGFIQDAFISFPWGQISGFSTNRNDPRLMVGDYSTIPYVSLVCAINLNTIWMLKNTSGTSFYWVV